MNFVSNGDCWSSLVVLSPTATNPGKIIPDDTVLRSLESEVDSEVRNFTRFLSRSRSEKIVVSSIGYFGVVEVSLHYESSCGGWNEFHRLVISLSIEKKFILTSDLFCVPYMKRHRKRSGSRRI